jgi:undecaprenyl phosphate N,N'-diacetylbacillosamine 1-phosphate transferase
MSTKGSEQSGLLYRGLIKPLLDRFFAFVGIILAAPIILCLIVLLLIFQRAPVFFIQPRIGMNDKVIHIYKLCTMNNNKDADGNLLPDERRLTSLGKFVRKTSLDELPQLANILLGHMSFIGPRPLLIEYLPLYDPMQRKRHSVRPGISGWAQVNGRNAISWRKKFEYDIWYVDHISFKLDLKILLMTLSRVIAAEGISGENTATMERFDGSN